MVSNKLNNKIAALSGVALKAPRSRRAGHQKMIVSVVTVLSAVEGRVHKVSNKLNNKFAALSGGRRQPSIVEGRWWLLHGQSWRFLTQDNIAESELLNPQSLY